MSFQDMDAQAKWELTALNALEQAVQANAALCLLISKAVRDGLTLDPEQLVSFIHDTQIRLARDLKTMRGLSEQRAKEQS